MLSFQNLLKAADRLIDGHILSFQTGELSRYKERLASKPPETDVARAETALLRAMARIEVLK